ncbi:unnamed protein product [Effrenium voratum]|nr:unnamed protein product [Effrenium voratum]CAJ1445129.1 unnamed protein product [Effrenium voratum]
MRKQRQEKSQSYRNLPYFQHLGSEEVFEALDRVRQANLLQMQLKMQKDCSYLQHMDDMSLEGRNAETVGALAAGIGSLWGPATHPETLLYMSSCDFLGLFDSHLPCEGRLAGKGSRGFLLTFLRCILL